MAHEAREPKLVRGKKLRVDTTVVQANIRYPTGAGLLADGIRVVTRAVKRVQVRGCRCQVPELEISEKVAPRSAAEQRVCRQKPK